MKRILILHYSQSGDVAKVAETFLQPLSERTDVEIIQECIQPVQPYPFPWRNLWRLFTIFPECILGPRDGIQPLSFPPETRFDLVILAYQVWHLAPSLPVQAFLQSDYAEVVNGSKVITLCVSRNMWQCASQTMKKRLRQRGAVLLDNVIVTHQGPAFATFVSVPRLLLFGKRDRLWGIFPPAEISAHDLERVTRLGKALAQRLEWLDEEPPRSLLTGMGAVPVKRRYIIAELVGWYCYNASARLAVAAERVGKWLREVVVLICLFVLMMAIMIGIPIIVIGTLLLYPLLFPFINRYAFQLAEPSGERNES